MSLPSIFDAPRGEHSAKPDRFYEIVDAFAPGPVVELFARRQWPGWTCLGDQMPMVGVANG
jgi:N6-adenosine-specific RNA methylase IME4